MFNAFYYDVDIQKMEYIFFLFAFLYQYHMFNGKFKTGKCSQNTLPKISKLDYVTS